VNNPDNISDSLENFNWVKILKFFDGDSGSRMEKIRIWDKQPGSATLPVICIWVSIVRLDALGFAYI
jgi:hypothetical protein